MTVVAPDAEPAEEATSAATLEVPGREHALVREHEAHPPLHERVPTPIAEDRDMDADKAKRGGEKGQDEAGETLHDEPESILDPDEEEEELRIPGSFDLSGPPQNRGNAKSWGDMLRNLRISR